MSRESPSSQLCARVAAECACEGLRRASRAMSKLYEGALAPLELTATQFAILVAVRLRGPVPLSRLAERLVLDRTSLYRAVTPLERRGCLRILPGRTRRERMAALTPRGRRLLADALPIWERIQQRVVGGLGPRTWAWLTSALAAIVPAVQAGRRRAGPGAPARPAPPDRKPRPGIPWGVSGSK